MDGPPKVVKVRKDDSDTYLKFKPLASSTLRATKENKAEDLKLGFANIPEQMQRKAVKKGFNFTLMVIGESGLGKSTFVNSLLNQSIYDKNAETSSQNMLESTTKIEKHFIELDERGVKLRLTIVDTPGFANGLNCTECWKPIVDYVDDTFYQFFKDECAINRKNIQDSRVHCCLYFISPTGRGLRPIDIELMKTLHHKVNIIPVIAKADSLTESELKSFKVRISTELSKHDISYYQPPICGSDEEDEFKFQDAEIRNSIPFSVIGSNIIVENESGRKCRGRQYPWGVVEVDNTKHCNFNILRTFILRTHMQDLKDVTNDILYENYRGQIIQTRMNRRKDDRSVTMASKAESNASSNEDIVDTSSLLLEKEEELQKMQNAYRTMQSQASYNSNPNSLNSSMRSQQAYGVPPIPNNKPTSSLINLSTTAASTNGVLSSRSPGTSVKSSSTVASNN